MRKTFTSLFLLINFFCFGNTIENPFEESLLTTPEKKKGTFYFRAATDSQAFNQVDLFPGLGIGYRRSFGHSGIDISMNYTEGKGFSQNHTFITWTMPKVSYLYYLTPANERSIYTGIGLGWGGAYYKTKIEEIDEFNNVYRSDKQKSDFLGLIPHATLGYELLRSSIITSFFELNISQALIPRSFHGEMIPKPIIELSVGAGF